MADVADTHAHVIISTEGEEALKNLGVIGAEAFAHIAAAAATGDFTGAVTYAFGQMSGALTEAAQRVISFVEEQAKLIETLSNLATATGTTVPEILGLREAFASVGITTQGFERAFGRLAITIGQEWSSIQASVRTSVDEQTAAMNHVEQSSLNVSKAYRNLGNVLRDASVDAQKDAEAIEGAAISLAKAEKALRESAEDSQKNSNSLAGAQLNLQRAQNTLAKDTGQALPYDERQLKVQESQLAVSEARERVLDAQNKKKGEALEREMKELAVTKARTELEAAQNKQIADQAAGIDKVRQAQLDIQKATVERSEAAEKAHQVDLKNIPAIAKEIEQVVGGYKKWDGVINHAEISATNLTKALVLAASGGSNEPPKAVAVFEEMSKLFKGMGDSADATNKKMEIVQKTMGAGFSAGRASAAQLLAVMEKGPEELHKFSESMNAFTKTMGMDELGKSTERIKEFNSESAQLDTTLDLVKARFGSILSQPISAWFSTVRESLQNTDGALNKLMRGFSNFLEGLAKFVQDIGSSIASIAGPAFSGLAGVVGDLLTKLGEGAPIISGFFRSFAESALLKAFISLGGEVISLIGDLFKTIGQLGAAVLRLLGIDAESFFRDMSNGVDAGSVAFKGLAVVVDTARIAVIGLRGALAAIVIALGAIEAGYDRVFGKAKSWEEATKNSKLFQAGKGMMESASKDMDEAGGKLKEDWKGFLEAAAKKQATAADKSDEAAGKQKDAADKAKEVTDKTAGAADKTAGSADKLSSAGDKAASAAEKQNQSAQQLAEVAEKLSAAAEKLQQVASQPPPSGEGKATGGPIHGPGGPRDDKAGLFALSDGEYVMQAAAVDHYGPQLFNALNSLAVGGFATGGAVGGVRAPSITSGPSTGPASVLNLTIDGQHFNGLQAPEHVATKLKTYAVGRQSSSAGRMPTWMR